MITELVKNQLSDTLKKREIPLVIELSRVPSVTDGEILRDNGLIGLEDLEDESFVFGRAAPADIKSINELEFVKIIDADREQILHIEPPGFIPTPIGIIEEEVESQEIISMNDTAEFVNAREAREEFNSDGKGVTVGVLDTGFDHPMINNAMIDEKDFTDTGLKDNVGHGSWVSGHILGRPMTYDGPIDEFNGEVLEGIAPEAKLVGAKVLNTVGVDAITAPQSILMKGMNWVVKEHDVDVVNMSLGVLPACGSTGSSRLLDKLVEKHNVLFTVAAGNAYTFGTIGSPGQAHMSITVSSVAARNPRANQISTFSSKGPACARSGINVAAPGGNIDPNEFILGPTPSYSEYGGSEGWGVMAGTSMSAPNTCGVFTQLKSSVGVQSRKEAERALAAGTVKAGLLTQFKGARYGWGVLNSLQMHRFLNDPIAEAQGKLRAELSLRDRKISPVSDFISSSNRKFRDINTSKEKIEKLNEYYKRQLEGEAIHWNL